MAGVIGFPRTVNDKAARAVAAGVVALAVATAATGWFWLTIPLAYGFWARVLTGPRLSPLGQLATRVIAPRLGEPKTVPGPPKRFAQAMGVGFSTTALVLGLVLGLETAATVVLVALAVAASLEAFAGLCLGCEIFRLGMRTGIVPETVCVECADIWARSRPQQA
ncbi:MAG: hypothetical protein QOG77_4084 [Solirubrobacteraceae bacterium]|jgi:hypothetical protein|nr:hypothetical protein [Solirubrobacteraceae bacterium]